MKSVIIDTNIVYYLSDVSTSAKFDKTKFESDKNKISITFFSLLEILLKFQYDKPNLIKTMNYLNENCMAFIHKQDENISYNHIFKKCLSSKNKLKYYKNKFTSSSIEYFIDFMVEFSLLIGGLYLGVLYKTDRQKNNISFLKSINFANHLHKELYNVGAENFKELFVNFYNSHHKSKIETRKLGLIEIIIEIFKMFTLLYETHKVLDPKSESFEDDFNTLKKQVKERTLDLKELNLKFSQYKNNKNFNDTFDKLYLELYSDRKNDLRTHLIKYIMRKFIIDLTFEFNDIIDCLNLLSFQELNNENQLNYLTCDKKWIDFLKTNQDKPNYKTMLDFIIKYISV